MATDGTGMSVSVRVLGEVAIAYDGIAPPESLRGVALLGWLAVHRGSRTRSEIASSLWPDVPDASARNSVRTALWALRRAFGDHADAVLDTSRNQIGLRGVEIDLQPFDELVEADRIDEALALASGELLAGLNDEWAILARDSHRHRVIALLTDCSDQAAADGEAVLAITRARQAAAMNPLTCGCCCTTVAAECVLVTRSCGVPLRGLDSGFTAHGRRLHGSVLRGLARLAVSAGLARRLQRYRWNV
jgi:DNA-binding SARP family transcriptional activator